ncbi:MAG: ABC transporter ATP-binding protein [Chloroflexota bacterium]|nr:ABC transporter ATP-binding protein [Chloroflexota bacterium]
MASALQVNDLRVYYHTSRGIVKAVDAITFGVKASERFGLIGESGSGKSTIALAIMRLIRPPGVIESGEIRLDGENLLDLSDEEMRQRRLASVAMVTQGAMNSLNPVIRIRQQFADGLNSHGVKVTQKDAREQLSELLLRVGLQQDVADMYPHQLSGGMKQRVCIALAMSLRPSLIIADEPTSALDVVVQRQVMQTLRQVQEDLNSAVILIGHDMGLMAQFTSRIGVTYAGKLVEEGPVRAVFRRPQHPYTQLLMDSLPSLEEKQMLSGAASGSPPSASERPEGCVFHPRCPYAMDQCIDMAPVYRQVAPEQWVACHLHNDGEQWSVQTEKSYA